MREYIAGIRVICGRKCGNGK